MFKSNKPVEDFECGNELGDLYAWNAANWTEDTNSSAFVLPISNKNKRLVCENQKIFILPKETFRKLQLKDQTYLYIILVNMHKYIFGVFN